MGYHISGEIKHHKKQYYDAFERTSSHYNKGDLGTFVYMFLEILEKAFMHVFEALQLLEEKYNTYIELLSKQSMFDEGTKALIFIFIQDTLFSSMGISINEVRVFLDKSKVWVRKKIYELEALNLMSKKRSGREYLYQIDLEILEKIID